jgi:myo-inositol-1(or 4)-monophosphatase
MRLGEFRDNAKIPAAAKSGAAQACPGEGFSARRAVEPTSERCWVADPIDGANNFLRGLPLWGVSLAYAVAGEPVIGLIYLPCVGRLYAAVRSQGATCNGAPSIPD